MKFSNNKSKTTFYKVKLKGILKDIIQKSRKHEIPNIQEGIVVRLGRWLIWKRAAAQVSGPESGPPVQVWRQLGASVVPVLGIRDRRRPGAQWSGSMANEASSKFTGHSAPRNSVRNCKEDSWP